MRLHETELPSTEPLRSIIESVLRDQGWEYRRHPVDPPELHLLVENVYSRREELGEGIRGVFPSSYFYLDADRSRRLATS